jgi:hypothetical protein
LVDRTPIGRYLNEGIEMPVVNLAGRIEGRMTFGHRRKARHRAHIWEPESAAPKTCPFTQARLTVVRMTFCQREVDFKQQITVVR